MNVVEESGAEEFFWFKAKDVMAGGGNVSSLARKVVPKDHIRGVISEQPVASLALPQSRLGKLPLSDVGGQPTDPDWPPLLVHLNLTELSQPCDGPRLPLEWILHLVRPGLSSCLNRSLVRTAVFWR
jgi:hypothetical protein